MLRNLNRQTQPFRAQPVFNNWDVLTKGWYLACPSHALRRGELQTMRLCGQHVVLFRGDDGKVRALDGFCPHMGTDLGIGKVVGNAVQCFFHQWQFDGEGQCIKIPCQEKKPDKGKLQSYATEEKYGFVWVYPEAVAPRGVAEFEEFRGKEVIFRAAPPHYITCHPHIPMINGIDVQHLRTVHNLNIDMQIEVHESDTSHIIDYSLVGALPTSTALERAGAFLLGGEYQYTVQYHDACVGLLGAMKRVKLFGKKPVPSTHMLWAYTPLERGRTRVQPIYVAEKRKGFSGNLMAEGLLALMVFGYHRLKAEDGRVYEGIRFHPNALLPIDGPVAKFIAYANRLSPSIWSGGLSEHANTTLPL